MSVKFYKRKPSFIEAVRLLNTEESIKECYEFTKGHELGYGVFNTPAYILQKVHESNGLSISTDIEEDVVPFGCWIIKGTKGDLYWITDEVFRHLYEVV